MNNAPSTVADLLVSAANNNSNHGVRYLNEQGTEHLQSYADLYLESQILLAGMRSSELRAGDIVIFQLDHLKDFVTAFWACLLGGIIPVPLSVPKQYSSADVNTNKLVNACQFLNSPCILTRTELAEKMQQLDSGHLGSAESILNVKQLQGGAPSSEIYNAKPDDIALMLLTSGSTGTPKAVMQNHKALVQLVVSTCQFNNFDANEVSLNWFPLDHVGGLVMFHIRDVYLGCHQVHAPTELVLQDPLRWLEWIEQYHATVTWAPNFAFALINSLSERVRARTWDLSSMHFILNAGEAIVTRTARSFLALLMPFGLPATAMHPAWGMSETASAVTYYRQFTLDSTSDDDAYVEVGMPIPGTSIRIVGDNDCSVPERTIGALQIFGPTVTCGYFRNPEGNADAFTRDGWLVTGDLGFIHQGALTVTGRDKDVIIVNGIVYPPHELEAVMEQITGVEGSYSAAVALRESGNDTDTVVAFFHSTLDQDEDLVSLINEVRGTIARNTGISIKYLIPVEKADIPKTEIGKIQRTKLRQRYEKGDFAITLDRLDAVRQRQHAARTRQDSRAINATEQIVYDAWKKILNIEYLALDDNFFELGGTSLKGIQLIAELEVRLNTKLSPLWLYERPTIAAMARSDSMDDLLILARLNRGRARRQKRARK